MRCRRVANAGIVKSLNKSGDRLLLFQRVTSRLFGSGENAEMMRAGREARAAGLNAAKSAVPPMPSLEQIGGVELPLLAPRLFDLINAMLTGAKAFKNFTLAKSLLVGHGRFPTNAFKAENVFSEMRPELLDPLTNQAGEPHFGSGESGRERHGVDGGRLGKRPVKLRERFLGAGDLQGGILQCK